MINKSTTVSRGHKNRTRKKGVAKRFGIRSINFQSAHRVRQISNAKQKNDNKNQQQQDDAQRYANISTQQKKKKRGTK